MKNNVTNMKDYRNKEIYKVCAAHATEVARQSNIDGSLSVFCYDLGNPKAVFLPAWVDLGNAKDDHKKRPEPDVRLISRAMRERIFAEAPQEDISIFGIFSTDKKFVFVATLKGDNRDLPTNFHYLISMVEFVEGLVNRHRVVA